MLGLLQFAYFESMGLWAVPYSLAGLFFTAVASRLIKGKLRLVCVAFTLALFFSLSLVVDRMAVPVPTLFAAGLWAVETPTFALNPPACRPSSEGCIPPDQGDVLLVVPFLVQWALLYVLLIAVSFTWRAFTARRRLKNGTKRVGEQKAV
jgi:hypothetical protein